MTIYKTNIIDHFAHPFIKTEGKEEKRQIEQLKCHYYVVDLQLKDEMYDTFGSSIFTPKQCLK